MKLENVDLYVQVGHDDYGEGGLVNRHWENWSANVIQKCLDDLPLTLVAGGSSLEFDGLAKRLKDENPTQYKSLGAGRVVVGLNGRTKDGGEYLPAGEIGPEIGLRLDPLHWIESGYKSKLLIPQTKLAGIENIDRNVFNLEFEFEKLTILNKKNQTKYNIYTGEALREGSGLTYLVPFACLDRE